MGGLHYFDLFVVLLIGLAIFGPKALQSVARNIGKGAAQTKAVKDKLMEELPVQELSEVSQHIPRVPLNTRQAVKMLITSEKGAETKTTRPSPEPDTKDSQQPL